MSETQAETPPPTGEEPQNEPGEQGNPDDLGDAGKQALDRMKVERNAATKKAAAVQKELDEFRQASMSEAEKAVAAARKEGATEAAKTFGTRLARTEFDAAAGRRNATFDTASALEYVDLTKFLDEDGEPDTAAIAAAVERLVPAPADGPPSFDGGTRTPPPAQTGMTGLIRKAAGRA